MKTRILNMEQETWVSKVRDIRKAKIFLKPGEKAPEGAQVQTGPRGGRFFESSSASAGNTTGDGTSSSPKELSGDTKISVEGQTFSMRDLPGFSETGAIPSTSFSERSTSTWGKLTDFIQENEGLLATVAVGTFALANPEVIPAIGFMWFMGKQKNSALTTIPDEEDVQRFNSYKDFAKTDITDPEFSQKAANLDSEDLIDYGIEKGMAQRYVDFNVDDSDLNDEKFSSYNLAVASVTDLPSQDAEARNKVLRDMITEDFRVILSEDETDSNGQFVLNTISYQKDASDIAGARNRRELLREALGRA